MAESANEIAALTERLRLLPIYPIFESCEEKNNLTALQFMCILNFHITQRNLFVRINACNQPKLLGQLLQFRQFAKFKYYDYQVTSQYGNYVLQCKYCELVGPCGCILTHMTINHNVHTGVVICFFCDREQLKTHINDSSLEQCYCHYMQRNNIEIDEVVYGIVVEFYDMLKRLCRYLNISTTRRKDYAGRGYKSKENLAQNYGDDISSEIVVRYMTTINQQNRSIQSDTLSREFEKIMDMSYGGNYACRTQRDRSSIDHNDVVVIDSDSDVDDNEVNDTIQNHVSNSLRH